MEYYPICFHESITSKQSKELSKIGVISPFLAGDSEINIYAYAPSYFQQSDYKAIKSIAGEFDRILQTVSINEIQKSQNKIEELNTIKTGSFVFFQKFKKLPFTLTSQDGDTGVIFFNLRHEPLSIEVSMSEIRLAPEDEIDHSLIYELRSHSQLNNRLIIDCDVFSAQTKVKAFYDILSCVMICSLQFSKKNLYLLNPPEFKLEFFRHLGLNLVYGSAFELMDTLSPEDIMITDHKVANPNILKLTDERYLVYQMPTLNEVRADRLRVREDINKKFKAYLQSMQGVDEASVLALYPQLNELLQNTPTPITTLERTAEYDIKELGEELDSVGAVYMSDNLEMILELVRG